MKTGSCSGKDLTELTFAEICCNYGLPAWLTHDNDVRFKKFWRSLWTLVGTKITATVAWNPQADPAERANRQVQEAMRAAVTTVGSYDEWDKALPHICFGLNTQVFSVTWISPFELLHGFAARTPISLGSSSVNVGKQERAAYDMALENANRYKAAASRIGRAGSGGPNFGRQAFTCDCEGRRLGLDGRRACSRSDSSQAGDAMVRSL
jgi:hypothetical protein